jgi:hypothetical protein
MKISRVLWACVLTALCSLLFSVPDVQAQSKKPDYSEVVKDAKVKEGLIKLHQKDGKLYGEITSSQLNKDFIVLIAIARGIGEGQLLGGMTWGFGDDWLWQFRKVEDNLHIVRRNVRFTATKGSPEEKAVKLAYTDSILFSLPIITNAPGGGMLVDLTQVFMSDLPQISRSLPGFAFASNKSNFASVKGFSDNVEIQVAATYASAGTFSFDTVPDSRGLTLNVHYSISLLPDTTYKPRVADDRVGYFITAVKDYSKQGDQDRFARYINRWDLQKADDKAELSPPKKSIIFYLEKTVPYAYRKPIRDGILEWNKAFEKAGFVNAIEVAQQKDSDDFDPEDVRFNTFRWITASAGFAMGPSRVNPHTGQILDADIIFDADFVQHWKDEYETFTPASVAALTGGPLDLPSYLEEMSKIPEHLHQAHQCRCEFHQGLSRELAFGSAAIALQSAGASSKEMQEKLIMQGLKEVTMHEVGHTLGLRHNFKASTSLSLEDLNDPEKTRESGMVASVMDYSPTNIVPKGKKQGDYYTTTLGPYDMWAIEYGYKSATDAEVKKIAARCGEPGLAFATDEDTRGIDSDPHSNRFDLGNDTVAYAKQQAQLINELWPGLVERVAKEGEGYQNVRRAFGILLGNYGRSMHFASRYVGGIHVNRDHKGDANAKPPYVIVAAEKQREALTLLEQQVFNDKPFQFPPELYNYLSASRWSHWGSRDVLRQDYAVHEVIAMWQDRILQQLLSSLTLDRLHDSELKIAADQDAFTTAELLDRLSKAIFAEADDMETREYTTRKPAISSLRRNLQRVYLKRLSNIALGNAGAPQDCQTIAYLELEELEGRIIKLLDAQKKLDSYSKAHLSESAARIRKVLEARLALSAP